MLDRQKIEAILARRFPGASAAQVAAAANAIIGMGDDWEEIDGHQAVGVPHDDRGTEFRLFRRREST